MTTPTKPLDSTPDADFDREVGDLLFLWNRQGHVKASWAASPYGGGGPTRVPDVKAAMEGASGIFLEFVQDPKKGKHLWKMLVTLRNGHVVIWTLNAKLFKRGWMSDLDDPVINVPPRVE